MKKRILPLGNKNLVGARVTKTRIRLGMKQVELLSRSQTLGFDIIVPALSRKIDCKMIWKYEIN